MSLSTIEIAKDEMIESLKLGYEEYRDGVKKKSSEVDLAHIKGFCTTIEQILTVYGEISKQEISDIKKPILGNISLNRVNAKVDYDIPTFMRKQRD